MVLGLAGLGVMQQLFEFHILVFLIMLTLNIYDIDNMLKTLKFIF